MFSNEKLLYGILYENQNGSYAITQFGDFAINELALSIAHVVEKRCLNKYALIYMIPVKHAPRIIHREKEVVAFCYYFLDHYTYFWCFSKSSIICKRVAQVIWHWNRYQ